MNHLPLLSATLLSMAFLPLAGAEEMGTICGPPALHVCVEYGTRSYDVYRPDVSVETWTYKCVLDMVCARTPDPIVEKAYVATIPIAYARVYCPPYDACFYLESDLTLLP